MRIRRRDRVASSGGAQTERGGLPAGMMVAGMVLLVNASVAFGKTIEQAGDPIEDTWEYLVELFRMMLGL